MCLCELELMHELWLKCRVAVLWKKERTVVEERKDCWSFITGFKDIFQLICYWTMKCILKNVQSLPNPSSNYISKRYLVLIWSHSIFLKLYYLCIQIFNQLLFMFVCLCASPFQQVCVVLFLIPLLGYLQYFLSPMSLFLGLIFNCRMMYYSKCSCNCFVYPFLQRNSKELIC